MLRVVFSDVLEYGEDNIVPFFRTIKESKWANRERLYLYAALCPSKISQMKIDLYWSLFFLKRR